MKSITEMRELYPEVTAIERAFMLRDLLNWAEKVVEFTDIVKDSHLVTSGCGKDYNCPWCDLIRLLGSLRNENNN